MRTILHRDALTPPQLSRIAGCGARAFVWRISGEGQAVNFWCGNKYCERCAAFRAKRAFAKMMEIFRREDLEAAYMLTITRRALPGQSLGWLRTNIARGADQWRHAKKRLAWDDGRIRRGQPPGPDGIRPTTKAVPGNGERGKPSLSLNSEYRIAGWKGVTGKTTYVWVREITTGREDNLWHVHRHIICPDLVTAQRISAAAASYDDPVQGDTPYVHHIGRYEPDEIAGYLAGYLTDTKSKKGGFESVARALDVREQIIWRMATKGMRRYDAGGEWRPLGIRPEPSDDPVVVVADEWGTYDAATYYSRGAPPQSKKPGRCRYLVRVKTAGGNCSINPSTYRRAAEDPSPDPRDTIQQNLCAGTPAERCEADGLASYFASRLIPPSLLEALAEFGGTFSMEHGKPAPSIRKISTPAGNCLVRREFIPPRLYRARILTVGNGEPKLKTHHEHSGTFNWLYDDA